MANSKFGVSKASSILRTMCEKIEKGTAIDISGFPKLGAYFVMDGVDPKQDYVDLEGRRWIRSIGQVLTATGFPIGRETAHVKPGTILASSGIEFCKMPGVKCVWQR